MSQHRTDRDTPRNSSGKPALPGKIVVLLRDVERAIAKGDWASADRLVTLALVQAPGHPAPLRTLGDSQFHRGLWREAAETHRQVLALVPDDVDALLGMGRALAAGGDHDAGIEALRRAASLRPLPETRVELGAALDSAGFAEPALEVADAILEGSPGYARARLLRARCLQALGRIEETATEYRELIRRRQEVPAAWFALMDIKTIRLDGDEYVALKRHHAGGKWNDFEKSLLGFALGNACEQNGDYAAAVDAFEQANAVVRRSVNWNAGSWRGEVESIQSMHKSIGEVTGSRQGAEVVFIVGLPRSGTTLIEQVLGAHSRVEGANELPDLAAVINAESGRRRQPFSRWAASASRDDWERLGQDYLVRTRRWRTTKPMHTDKMPENWIYTYAIRAMLPAARIIDVRRDPLETCWSCFKQLFAPHRVAYSYRYDELASYWSHYENFMTMARHRHPSYIRRQSYEAFQLDPRAETESLLEFCGLPLEADCLEPHRAVRVVRTASAAQVRQPLSRSTARSVAYAESLNGLRSEIEKFAVASHS